MDDRFWSYEQNLLLLKPLGMNEPPQEMELIHADFWVQVYNLPMNMQNKRTLEAIGGFLGTLKKVNEERMDGI